MEIIETLISGLSSGGTYAMIALGYTMVYSDKLDKMVSKKDRKREFLSLYLWQAI